MAIYFNNLILEPKANGTALEKRYYEELQEVKGLFEKFKKSANANGGLTFSREFKKVYNRNKTSWKPAPPIAIPMNVNIYDPQMGSVEIRYSKSPPIKTGNNLMWNRGQESLIFETLTVRKDQLDLAWFLLYASDFVKKGTIKLVDKEAEYEGTVGEMKLQLEAQKVIFDEGVTYEKLEAISVLMFPNGDVQSDTGSKAELATKLWKAVIVNEKNKLPRGYKDLIAAAEKVEKQFAKEESSTEDITVTLANGEELTVPLQRCPLKISTEKLHARAKELDFPIDGLSRDIIFSIIKYKTGS